ncbi:hypothetical protein AB0J47_17990 [Nocardia sp. NPDC049737]|uniref:hypothetical protein n=1 Tax=Nocardia sp. NPDC049737 TaxID=3154358 RepID=UPI00342745FC
MTGRESGRRRFTRADYINAFAKLHADANAPSPERISSWIRARRNRRVAANTIGEWLKPDPVIPRTDESFLLVLECLHTLGGKPWPLPSAVLDQWKQRRADAFAEARSTTARSRTGSASAPDADTVDSEEGHGPDSTAENGAGREEAPEVVVVDMARSARRRVHVTGAVCRPVASATPPQWKRPLSYVATPGKAVLSLMVTGVIGGVITLLLTIFGPAITAAVSSGPPIAVVVQTDAPLTVPGKYAIPGTLPDHPPHLNFGPDLVAAHPDALSVGVFNLKLILEGRRSRPVVITDLRPRVLTRSSPVTGTLFETPAQGTNDTVSGCVYLDDPAAGLMTANSSGGQAGLCEPDARPFFAEHYLTLNRGEQAVINVRAEVSKQSPLPSRSIGSYEWELLLTMVEDGKTSHLTIRDGAQPFRLTSFAPAPGYQAVYTFGSGDADLKAVDPAQWYRDRFNASSDGPPR